MIDPRIFILDVDGVMTDGKFYYSAEGKVYKVFGADDADALGLLKKYIDIRFITADKKGFSISKKRIVEDMGYKLDLVSTISRIEWIKNNYNLENVIFMGDGIFDHYVMRKVGYSISPNNADKNTKLSAKYITKNSGGDRAVAEACLHILKVFFEPYNPEENINKKDITGEWSK